MFKLDFECKKTFPDTTLAMLYMLYMTFITASIILAYSNVSFVFFGHTIQISGAVIPYTMLYPISFIVLRIYGYRSVNQMIGCMIIAALVFAAICHTVVALPGTTDITAPSPLKLILHSAYQMYFAGFIALPAGMYSSFLALALFDKIGLKFGVLSISLSTMVGEFINTIIVFPLAFHGQYSIHAILQNIVADALVFKFTIGIALSIVTVVIVNYIVNKYEP